MRTKIKAKKSATSRMGGQESESGERRDGACGEENNTPGVHRCANTYSTLLEIRMQKILFQPLKKPRWMAD